MADKDFHVDVIIDAGELNGDYHFKDNDLRIQEVVMHDVPYSKFLEYIDSGDCYARKQELYRIAEKSLGKEYWMYYYVSCFCTRVKPI